MPVKVGGVPDARSHLPCQVSSWYHTACGGGAVGLNVLVAVNLNGGACSTVVMVHPDGLIAV